MDAFSWIALTVMVATLAALWKIRKRKEYKYGLMDTSSIILNLVLIVMVYPPLSVAAGTMAAKTSFGMVAGAMGRLTPAVCVAGVGASAILRRKERPGLSFLVQFAGALWFGLTLLIAGLSG